MQGAAGVGGQADDVARVGRDFGVDEDDVKHALIVLHARCASGYGLRARDGRDMADAQALVMRFALFGTSQHQARDVRSPRRLQRPCRFVH